MRFIEKMSFHYWETGLDEYLPFEIYNLLILLTLMREYSAAKHPQKSHRTVKFYRAQIGLNFYRNEGFQKIL